MPVLLSFSNAHFNPRSREGSDGSPIGNSLSIMTISIHAPARGATILVLFQFTLDFHFNPRSREGSDEIFHMPYALITEISIHAPARGATKKNRFIAVDDIISIHAPARGATHSQRHINHSSVYFNPRSREGSDLHRFRYYNT